jgi:restriction system protein
MAIWLIRAGKRGQYEQKFIQDKRVYVTWGGLKRDLFQMKDRGELFKFMEEVYPDAKSRKLHNWVSQVWPFAHEIKKGDFVVLPLKSQPSVYVGEVTTSDYHFEPDGPNPYYHWRAVKWIGEGIPRSHFGKDLLHSFGAFMTICRIKRNSAEDRIKAMLNTGWKADPGLSGSSGAQDETEEGAEAVDLEEQAQDQIALLIAAKFKGHDLARLVEAILRAQGYTTFRSPEGPDGGVDILAGAAPLGFSSPKMCVQVKSQDAPVGRPEIDQLMGVMKKVQANEALFVSWSGFKPTVPKEVAPSFFSVRLWNRNDLLEQLFSHYDRLDEDIKAELPLKRIWTVASPEED